MLYLWKSRGPALNGRGQEMDGAFVYFNFIAFQRGSVEVQPVFLPGKGKHVVK